ncbi:putative udp-glucoronosyl and udp-glucosyl transferase family protein [Rosellinia necatrix]|uniref:Putative udp-glucoronosyl and udp-glucosyl transferase family protein n=1 Tax=Rosellinia necatrix TaxID=77044 RepID=A0A1W2TU46_ROSNE|nr:putative udp-glucoronosyl and udp-glucosyl transferase family protein [Rosellinia necatrix]
MGRLRQLAIAVAAFAVLVATFLAQRTSSKEEFIPPVQGKNETVLFFINTEYGLSNVHLATASALLEKHPGIDVHIASFSRTGPKVAGISSLARRKAQNARGIHFHEIPGPEYAEALSSRMGGLGRKSIRHVQHAPGMKGIDQILRAVQPAMSPWNGTEHLGIYQKATELIQSVDPAVVVLDIAFRPTIDAAINSNRLYAYIAPNILADTFWVEQPYGGMLWKYSRIGCGFPFPVPWRNIPENIYITVRFIYAVLTRPDFKGTREFLAAHGIRDSITMPRPNDRPWIAQNMAGASLPLDLVPPNVTSTGPIVFDPEPAAERDPELVAWLSGRPTVLVNLGSLFTYSEHHATTMALALQELLARTDVQVLWKMARDEMVPGNYTLPVQGLVDAGRLRVVDWLTVSPPSILATGHIVASAHHGGANCYHEAIGAGVPQVVIPMWLDCYNYAQLAEDVGVGVYATRDTAPYWTVAGLLDSFLRVLDGGPEARRMADKAAALGDVARREPGRYVAAREIARLAEFGHA